MTGYEIAQLPKLEWMPSRIPLRDALVAFVSDDGGSGCPPAVELACKGQTTRWYPQPRGLRVLILYEGGSYDSSTFHIEREAWDHESCDVCDERIPAMTLCHVTKRGRYIALCETCYRKHIGKVGHAA